MLLDPVTRCSEPIALPSQTSYLLDIDTWRIGTQRMVKCIEIWRYDVPVSSQSAETVFQSINCRKIGILSEHVSHRVAVLHVEGSILLQLRLLFMKTSGRCHQLLIIMEVTLDCSFSRGRRKCSEKYQITQWPLTILLTKHVFRNCCIIRYCRHLFIHPRCKSEKGDRM